MEGDCLSCQKVSTCTDTSVQKVLDSYTCGFFRAVEEAVFRARIHMLSTFPEREAVKVIMGSQVPMFSIRTNEDEGEGQG